MLNKKLFSKSAQETKNIAKQLAKNLSGPSLFLLNGDLGSGKTTFVQGLAEGLGIKNRITSPTFVLVKKYHIGENTPLQSLWHIDLYRLNSKTDLEKLGLKDILKENSVIAVEWPEKIKDLKIGFERKIFNIDLSQVDESKRKIIIHEF